MKKENNLVSKKLLPKGRTIYFNEELHKYTDDLGNTYVSVTTLLHKYLDEFKAETIAKACEKIGKNPRHKDYEKYRNKTAKQLLYEWKLETERACKEGTAKHNFLEEAIKNNNGYKTNAKGLVDDKIYTIDDIIKNHKYGRLTLNTFEKSGVKEKYPQVYSVIETFVNKGFKIYAEIGVYDSSLLISGLIDVLLVRNFEFVILDWKTNKAPIRFESGYYGKDSDGLIDEQKWIPKDDKFRFPLDHLADSIGNHYAMQLSSYAHFVETFGYKCIGIVLCHIRTIPKSYDAHGNPTEIVKILPMPYLKGDVETMIGHYTNNNINKINPNLFT